MSFTPKSDLPSYLSASGLAHPDTWDATTQTYNITQSSTARFRLALAKAKAGVAPCNVDFHGDSITGGFDVPTPREVNSWPEQVRAFFQSSGRWGTVYEGGPLSGTAGQSPQTSGYIDTRLTWSAGVGRTSAGAGVANAGDLGGNTGGTITFGPVSCDVFDVYDLLAGFAAGSGWTWAVDGGAGTFVSQSGSGTGQGNRKTTISAGTYGSHTLTLTLPGAQYGIITGIGVRKSTDTGGVYMRRLGCGGAAVGDGSTVSAPFSFNTLRSKEFLLTTIGAPSFVIISLGTNAEPTTSTPAQWLSNMTAWVQACQTAGADVMLALAPPGGPNTTSAQHTYLAGIAPLAYQIADATNCSIMDWFWRWGGSYTTAMDQYFQNQAFGHTNLPGANDQAFGVYNALCKVA